MNKFTVIFLIIILNLAFTNCADESYQSASTTEETAANTLTFDRSKLSPIDDKFLFLEEFYNQNGEKIFKEPYHYHISIMKILRIRQGLEALENQGVEVRIPSSDCNVGRLECSEDNGIFSCTLKSTLIGCFYHYELSQYYQFPMRFSIDLKPGTVAITDADSKSKAVFKIYDTKDQLPVYKEPMKILD